VAVKHFSKTDELLTTSTLSIENGNDNLQISGTRMQDGGVRLIWISQNFAATEIFSQRFDANGTAVGLTKIFNPAPGQLISHPQINVLKDSSYMVSWRQDDDLAAQIFGYNDLPISEILF